MAECQKAGVEPDQKYVPGDCPRCGGAFVCRSTRISNCWCLDYQVSPRQLAELRLMYEGCLCEGCLAELAD